MIEVRFSREARDEFPGQIRWYEALEPGLGSRFALEIERAVQMVGAFPRHGRPGPSGTRIRRVARFPFSVVYGESGGGIVIHAIAGSRRHPGYWVERIGRNRR